MHAFKIVIEDSYVKYQFNVDLTWFRLGSYLGRWWQHLRQSQTEVIPNVASTNLQYLHFEEFPQKSLGGATWAYPIFSSIAQRGRLRLRVLNLRKVAHWPSWLSRDLDQDCLCPRYWLTITRSSICTHKTTKPTMQCNHKQHWTRIHARMHIDLGRKLTVLEACIQHFGMSVPTYKTTQPQKSDIEEYPVHP